MCIRDRNNRLRKMQAEKGESSQELERLRLEIENLRAENGRLKQGRYPTAAEEMERLRNEIKALQRENEALKAENQKLTQKRPESQELADLRKDLTAAREQIKLLEQENFELRQRVGKGSFSLIDELERVRRLLETEREQLAEAKQRMVLLGMENQRLSDVVKEIEDQLQFAKSEPRNYKMPLEYELHQVSNEVKRLKAFLDERNAELETVRREMNEQLGKTEEQARQRMEDTRVEADYWRGQFQTADARIKRLEDAEARSMMMDKETRHLHERLAERTREAEGFRETALRHELEAKLLGERIRELQIRLNTAGESRGNLEGQIQEKTRRVEALSKELNERDENWRREVERLEKQVADLKATVDELQEHKKRNDLLMRDLKQLEGILKDREAEIDSLRRNLLQFEQQHGGSIRYAAEIDSLRQKLNEAQRMLEMYRTRQTIFEAASFSH
eukprot:TRINITY_DN2776_c0_g1_i1.p1 TRINITY_DN2776_c0_g1~~TRINITY_DN2776_c0_g1_i1.p1  ORF type:complete len:449 (-),score=141.88 TRINITY_DN2776_c0_g1_i1:127-1473(-)